MGPPLCSKGAQPARAQGVPSALRAAAHEVPIRPRGRAQREAVTAAVLGRL